MKDTIIIPAVGRMEIEDTFKRKERINGECERLCSDYREEIEEIMQEVGRILVYIDNGMGLLYNEYKAKPLPTRKNHNW